MPSFSHWMPPTPVRRSTPVGRLMLIALAAGVLAAVVVWPVARYVAVVLLAAGGVSAYRERSRLRRLAAARAGEDIGTFARAFDRRLPGFDPRVVRAVWDALTEGLPTGGAPVPLRPTDDLGRDLRFDPDEIELYVLPEVAARTDRDLRAAVGQPAAQGNTVADLVAFVSALPKRAASG